MLPAIAILIALIALSFAACEAGLATGVGWPPADILAKYGLSGFSEPAGANMSEWEIQGNNDLYIAFNGTAATVTAISTWFSNNSWSSAVFVEDPDHPGLFILEGSKGRFFVMIGYRIDSGVYKFEIFAWKE